MRRAMSTASENGSPSGAGGAADRLTPSATAGRVPQHVDWRGTGRDGPIYAVGDIHGMSALLEAMIVRIEQDAAAIGAPARVVFLGDAINRGPNSRQVVERLLGGPQRPGDRWVVLRGNDEQALLDGLDDEAAFAKFLRKGGAQTLLSYGLSGTGMTRAGARAAIPPAHLAFMSRLPLTCRTESHVFVHAGVRAGREIEAQEPADLMTLREPFFSHAAHLPWTVVHGHTPSAGAPVVARGRIGVDTGACLTGVLTGVVIAADAPPRFLSVRSRPSPA